MSRLAVHYAQRSPTGGIHSAKYAKSCVLTSVFICVFNYLYYFSGNLMGDIGARMLAKALMINTKLRTIHWDRNNTSAQGFQDLASALQKYVQQRSIY